MRDAKPIFIAASFLRMLEARQIAKALMEAGLMVQARWLWEHPTEYVLDDTAMAAMAVSDLEDLQACGSLVCLTGDAAHQKSRGGKHCEFGWALGRGHRVAILGPREHPYHWHEAVRVTRDVKELVKVLRG